MDTATISLERLKELELIERAMREKKNIAHSSTHSYNTYYLLDENSTVDRLVEIITDLRKENSELYKEKYSKQIRGWFR